MNVVLCFYSKTPTKLSFSMTNCLCTFANTTKIQKALTYKAVFLFLHHWFITPHLLLSVLSTPVPPRVLLLSLSSSLSCPLNLLLTLSAALSLSRPLRGLKWLLSAGRMWWGMGAGRWRSLPAHSPPRSSFFCTLTGCVVVKLLL